ncbi:MAG TPA: glycosyltransferase family 9 protein, partial [Verrucomicrobiota bacterium]|nr:glycosyltransferase family 9 protein [Verrucomicrobiota bacterium]
ASGDVAAARTWIDAGLAPLLEGDPDLATLIPFDRHRWRTPRIWVDAGRELARMRRARYDLVIDLQALARSSLIAWLARGRLTIGLDDTREGASALYDIRVPRPSPTTHAVDWYLAVLRLLEIPVHRDFVWLPERVEVADRIRARWPGGQMDWVGISPGARWENKRWPAERYAALVARLAEECPQLRFAVLGAASDRALAEAVCAGRPDRCVNLAGQISLPEMVEWIRRCRVLVSNDTGPMHVAAALGTPVVALFGPTDPRRTGPYDQVDHVLQHPLACVPCLKSRCSHAPPLECLRLISVDQVCEAVRQRLGEPSGVATRDSHRESQ